MISAISAAGVATPLPVIRNNGETGNVGPGRDSGNRQAAVTGAVAAPTSAPVQPLAPQGFLTVQRSGRTDETGKQGTPPTLPGPAGGEDAGDQTVEGERKGNASAQAPEAKRDKDAPGELSEEERRQVEQMRKRDAEVRKHEQAHVAAGQPHAGSPSYSYETGPDGRRYVVDGEVPIDVSPVPGDPQATVQKMQIVKRAALAPAQPSGQDRRVAADAEAKRAEAAAELRQQRAAEAKERIAPAAEEDNGLKSVPAPGLSEKTDQANVEREAPTPPSTPSISAADKPATSFAEGDRPDQRAERPDRFGQEAIAFTNIGDPAATGRQRTDDRERQVNEISQAVAAFRQIEASTAPKASGLRVEFFA